MNLDFIWFKYVLDAHVRGRVLNGELYADFFMKIYSKFVPMIGEKSSWNSLYTNADKLTSVIFEYALDIYFFFVI